MTSERRSASFARAAAALVALSLAPGAQAQIVRDGTIGPADTTIDFYDPATSTWHIGEDLGAQSGGNLYHSFSEFSIPSELHTAEFSWSASLDHPSPPVRVVSRVSGGSRSFLRGLLRLDGGLAQADFFLLNPAGVTVSTGAQLDVGGSVNLSTADELRFEDGVVLDTAPIPPSSLSAASPAAFGFASLEPASVSLSNLTELRVPPGQQLVIVGGEVRMSNSLFGEGIRAPGASVVLASAGGPTEIPVDVASLDPAAAAPGELGPVAIVGDAHIDVSSEGNLPAGAIVIRAGRFELAGSLLVAHDVEGVAPLGGIDIAVTDALEIGRNSVARAPSVIRSSTGSDQRGGDVSLRAGRIQIEMGALLSESSAAGAGGTLALDAGEIRIAEAGQVGSLAEGAGEGGAIELTGGTLEVRDGGLVASDTTGSGPGGDIRIAMDAVTIANAGGSSDLTAIAAETSSPVASGQGGSLSLSVRSLELEAGGQLLTNTDGAADAGGLSILDADRVRVHGRDALLGEERPSGITTRALENATAGATGGPLTIEAALIEVEDGAQISSATFGRGQAGALTLRGNDVRIAGGPQFGAALVSSASFPGVPRPELGAGGLLTIEADSLSLQDGGQISTAAAGAGDAGAARIAASRIEIEGRDPRFGSPSGIFGLSDTAGVASGGRGADFAIDASESLSLRDGGRITVETLGSGAAGTILLDGEGELVLDSDAGISAVSSAAATGSPGRIEIRNASRVALAGGSEIAARVENPASVAPAGGILIEDVGSLSLDGGAAISAETAGTSAGGAIELTLSGSASLAGGAAITARSTGSGNAGAIAIDAGRTFTATSGSAVTTEANLASGGDIALRALDRISIQDSQVTTSVLTGAGGGGDVTLAADQIVLDRGLVRAQAIDGRGGDITITAGVFLQSADSLVSATSQTGIDGVVVVNAPGGELIGKVAKLPATYLDAAALLRSACAARTREVGSFVVQPREVVLAAPDVSLASPRAPSLRDGATSCPGAEVVR